MKDLAKKILLALGYTEAQITDMESEAPKGVEAELIAHAVEHQKTLLKNDATFIGEIQKAEKGKVLSTVDSFIKKTFALTPEEVKEAKTTNDLITIGQAKTMKTAGASTEQLQQELVAANSRNKELTEVEIPKIRGEVDQAKKKIYIDSKAIKLVDGIELAVNRTAADERVLLRIERDYDVEENEKGELIPKDKKTGLQPKSSDGTKLLTLKEIILSDFEQAGFLKKSGGVPPNPAPGSHAKPAPEPGKKSEGVIAAEANLKENMPKANV